MGAAQLVLGGSVEGGLYRLAGNQIDRIDDLPTVGIAVDAAGQRVARVLRGFDPHVAEVLIYDEVGVSRYLRLPGVVAAHGIAWDGDELLVASSGTNEIVRFSAGGERLRTWNPGGTGDAWHLNCLASREGAFFASAAGTSDTDLSWNSDVAGGVIVPLDSGVPVVTGLRRPHHPTWLDDTWLVCESAAGTVTRFDASGTRLHEQALGGWTRGLAVDDDYVYVGVSSDRERPGPPASELVRLDRRTLAIVDRVPVAARELWDLVFIPDALVAAMESGFASGGAMATAATRDHAAPPISSDVPMTTSDVSATLSISELPATATPGQRLDLDWTLTNTGGHPLSPIGAFPFRIGMRWSTAAGLVSDRYRATLPGVLAPGDSCSGRSTLTVPPDANTPSVTLTVSVLQELCWWLRDEVPAHGAEHELTLEL